MLRTLTIAVLLAGCTSYTGLRDMQPLESTVVSGDLGILSKCVLDELRRVHDASYDLLETDRPDLQTVRIAARFRNAIGGSTNMFSWEVALRKLPENRVQAELRSIRSMWGTPLGSGALDVVTECSQTAASHR